MGFGMIGALGGAGAALTNESKFLERRDEKNDDLARSKDLQGWLLQQQEQYAIRTEGRTDARAEASKDRDFARTQAEAPTRSAIAVTDEQNKARGKSAVALETLPADTTVATAQAEAKETKADKAVKAGTAHQHEATAGFYEGARTAESEARAAAAANGKGKMAPEVAEEARSLREQINKLSEQINAQRVQPGAWDPERNPSQKRTESDLAALQLRHRQLVSGGSTPPDILGIRQPQGGTSAPGAQGKGYGMISSRAQEPAPNVDAQGKFNTSDPNLSRSIDDIKDPQERANARLALTNQTAPIVPSGGAKPAGPAAPAPAAATAAPAVATGASSEVRPLPSPQQELDALDPADVGAMDDELQRAAAGRRAPRFPNPALAQTVNNLRRKLSDEQNGLAAQSRARQQTEQESRNQKVRDSMAGFGRGT